jgi:hypothetical protein
VHHAGGRRQGGRGDAGVVDGDAPDPANAAALPCAVLAGPFVTSAAATWPGTTGDMRTAAASRRSFPAAVAGGGVVAHAASTAIEVDSAACRESCFMDGSSGA